MVHWIMPRTRRKLRVFIRVYSLAVLDDKGFAAGTTGGTVDLFNVAALQTELGNKSMYV